MSLVLGCPPPFGHILLYFVKLAFKKSTGKTCQHHLGTTAKTMLPALAYSTHTCSKKGFWSISVRVEEKIQLKNHD